MSILQLKFMKIKKIANKNNLLTKQFPKSKAYGNIINLFILIIRLHLNKQHN